MILINNWIFYHSDWFFQTIWLINIIQKSIHNTTLIFLRDKIKKYILSPCIHICRYMQYAKYEYYRKYSVCLSANNAQKNKNALQSIMYIERTNIRVVATRMPRGNPWNWAGNLGNASFRLLHPCYRISCRMIDCVQVTNASTTTSPSIFQERIYNDRSIHKYSFLIAISIIKIV